MQEFIREAFSGGTYYRGMGQLSIPSVQTVQFAGQSVAGSPMYDPSVLIPNYAATNWPIVIGGILVIFWLLEQKKRGRTR